GESSAKSGWKIAANRVINERSRLVCSASQQARSLRFPELDRSVSKVMRTNKNLVYTLDFSEIGLKDPTRVGGKNASLGELFNSLKPRAVGVVDGFATTADAYRALLAERELEYELRSLVS